MSQAVFISLLVKVIIHYISTKSRCAGIYGCTTEKQINLFFSRFASKFALFPGIYMHEY